MMLEAKEICKGFDGLGVLRGISLSIAQGEVMALIGPSGSGKSTLLRCLNQLETIDSGEITLDGETMCSMKDGVLTYAPEKKLRELTLRMGMVFQSFNLFPHRTVLQNLIDAPIRVKKMPREQATEQAHYFLKKVGLESKATKQISPSTISRYNIPTSFPAVSPSGWPSLGRCVCTRRSSALTSPLRHWTPS